MQSYYTMGIAAETRMHQLLAEAEHGRLVRGLETRRDQRRAVAIDPRTDRVGVPAAHRPAPRRRHDRKAGRPAPLRRVIIEGMATRVSSPVLIGRSVEFERLRAALRGAREGRSSAIVVAGEAGVGKTRLVSEFADFADRDGAVVLSGGCIVLGDGSLPYAPVVEALRGLVRRLSPEELDAIVGNGRADLARLVPDLGPATDEDGSGLDSSSAQGRLFEMLLGLLDRLAAMAPVVFIVEDLHWSDRSTRDLIGFLIRNLRDVRVTLVLTYRSDELHRRHPLLPFLAELDRSGRVERLELSPFDRAESAQQLRAIAGRDLDADLVESIHARSGGNAFFAEELLVATSTDRTGELPSTLRDLLLARVTELAEPTQEFLRVASAAGQRVDPALLAAAADLDEAALYDALRECVNRQVLIPDPSAGRERYAFRHALLQEAVYDDLLPGERTRLHAAFARTLEASAAGDPTRAAEVAYHWYAAHDLPRALESAAMAGDAAERRYAFPEALAQYERVLELWGQVPDAETRVGHDRVELLARAGSVARFHDATRAVALFQTAIKLVDETADPARASLLNERLGRCAWIAGQGMVANVAYRAAVRLSPPEPPSVARARAMAGLAQILMLGARFEESRTWANDAMAAARAVGARDVEGHALNTRGIGRGTLGEIDEGIEDLRVALEIAEEVGSVDDIGRAHANLVFLLDGAGRLEEAVEAAWVGIRTTERLGLMRFFGTHLLCGIAEYQYRLGNWDAAEDALRRAADIGPLGINEILEQELLGSARDVPRPVRRGRRAPASPGVPGGARRGRPVHRPGAGDPDRARAVGGPAGRRGVAGGDGDPARRVHAGGPHRRGLRARRPGQRRRRRARPRQAGGGAAGACHRDGGGPDRRPPAPARGGRRPSPTRSPPSRRRGCVSARPRGRDCIAGRAPTPGSRPWRHGTASGARTWPRTRGTARRRRGSRRRAIAVPRRRRSARRSRPRRDSMPCRSSARSRGSRCGDG